jgi:hypothetical protein
VVPGTVVHLIERESVVVVADSRPLAPAPPRRRATRPVGSAGAGHHPRGRQRPRAGSSQAGPVGCRRAPTRRRPECAACRARSDRTCRRPSRPRLRSATLVPNADELHAHSGVVITRKPRYFLRRGSWCSSACASGPDF